jgi:hypothetical protein
LAYGPPPATDWDDRHTARSRLVTPAPSSTSRARSAPRSPQATGRGEHEAHLAIVHRHPRGPQTGGRLVDPASTDDDPRDELLAASERTTPPPEHPDVDTFPGRVGRVDHARAGVPHHDDSAGPQVANREPAAVLGARVPGRLGRQVDDRRGHHGSNARVAIAPRGRVPEGDAVSPVGRQADELERVAGCSCVRPSPGRAARVGARTERASRRQRSNESDEHQSASGHADWTADTRGRFRGEQRSDAAYAAYGARRSFAMKAACVIGIFSANSCSQAAA